MMLSTLYVQYLSYDSLMPNGTSFARPSFDQPLLALSIQIVKLTTLAFRNPRGTTGAVLRVTFCCSHCRFSKKRGTLFFLRIPLLSHRAPDRTRTYTSLNTRS